MTTPLVPLAVGTVTRADNTSPVLTSPGTQVHVVHDVVILALTASDADQDVLTFSAEGLPEGVNIDPYTGLISGVPDEAAVSTTPYEVTVTVDDQNGGVVSQSFRWLVHDSVLAVQGGSLQVD